MTGRLSRDPTDPGARARDPGARGRGQDDRASGLSRIVLVDKPEGWTSYDVVRRAKSAYRGKIGHAGTLDPFATGLLLVLFGQATRVSSLMMDLPKQYEVTVQFGAVSSTGDPTGDVSPTGGRTDMSAILRALDHFRGEIQQKVPLTSAVKVDGEPLYRKAHRGETADTPERAVMVYGLDAVAFDAGTQRLELLALTGKGTYVRRLAEDIGTLLGVGAYAAALRRTKIGRFRADQAVTPDALTSESLQNSGNEGAQSGCCLTLSRGLSHLPAFHVDAATAARVANGNDLTGGPGGLFSVRSGDRLLALYEGPQTLARPRVVFPVPEE